MKRVLDDLMLQCPCWMIQRHINEHPSRGLDIVLRALQKRLPRLVKCGRNGYITVYSDVVYTGVRLTAKEESYDIVVEFTSNCGQGYLEIPGYGIMGARWYIKNPSGGFKCWIPNLATLKSPEGDIGNEMFEIIQDHREYPIWTTRCATLAFLLCARSLPFPPEISEMIAKEVWASRHNRKIWWPDITDDDWNRDD
jgi:hypothetical protein